MVDPESLMQIATEMSDLEMKLKRQKVLSTIKDKELDLLRKAQNPPHDAQQFAEEQLPPPQLPLTQTLLKLQ